MSNPTIVAGVRAAMAANLATHRVPWTQHSEGYDPATGNSPAPVTTTVDALIYGERSKQDDAGTETTEVTVLVIAEDLPNPVQKGDAFEFKGHSWAIGINNQNGLQLDPTQSFYEGKARR